MTRREYHTIAASFVAGYRSAVEPYQQPAAFGIRRHAWRETVNSVIGTLKANDASFDLTKFRNEIVAGIGHDVFAE